MIDLAGDEWRRALEQGLGAEVLPVDGPAHARRRLVVFKKGPFRVGYADFTAGVATLDDEYEAAMRAAAVRHGVDVIRYQAPRASLASPRHSRFPLDATVISGMQGWDERRLEKPRRTSNRMRRTELLIRRAETSDAAAMNRLYVATMRRHGGARRYGEAYFSAIAETSGWVACLRGAVVGFVASGRLEERGLYLHGGHCDSARGHYPSDLLFLAMLREAKQQGLESFDFLASPPHQRSLVEYKRAWGAEVRPIVVSDHPLGWRGLTFSVAYAAMAALTRR